MVASSIGQPHSVAIGDIDGDGDQDIAGAIFIGSDVMWWENDGNGDGWTTHTVDNNFNTAWSVKAVDIDKDGDVDIAAVGSGAGHTVAWWENRGGTGTVWLYHEMYTAMDDPQYLDIADMDNDGDLDVIVSEMGGSRAIFIENANTSCTEWVIHVADAAFGDMQGIAAADVDGDGDNDIIGGSRNYDYVAWIENNEGDGTSWTRHSISTDVNQPKNITPIDMDKDSDVDFVVVSRDGNEVAWFENMDGQGRNWTKHTVDASFSDPYNSTVADIDSDGDPDIIAASVNGLTTAWFENLDTNGTVWTKHTLDNALDGGGSVAVGDLDGDGDTDVVAGATTADVVAWYENQTPHPYFTEYQKLNIIADGYFFALAIDFQGNIIVATLAQNTAGTIRFPLTMDDWIGVYIYDYTERAYTLVSHYKKSKSHP